MTENMQKRICALTELAASKARDPAGGITRLLYSKEWVDTLQVLKAVMEEEGMETRFDEVGNLYGRISGTEKGAGTVMTGSHVDSVKNGGKYDGMFGIIAGITAVGSLYREFGPPRRSLEVAAFAEEEGSRFPTVFWGSRNFLGKARPEDVEGLCDEEGILFADAMHGAGFDFRKDSEGPKREVKAFLEVHIEQGNVLERENLQIGVVNSIAGQRRFTVRLSGTANHAGTTPMSYRRDAFYAAALMIGEILNRAREYGAPLVATAGHVEVKPNMGNVVPGEAKFSLDVRHTDEEFLERFTEEMYRLMEKTARECGVDFSADMWMKEPPVPMDGKLVRCLEQVCLERGFSYRLMHSGAGHDSQLIAKEIPTAMIFVPSRDGISHNPAEYTAPEELERGVQTLRDALYRLAYMEEVKREAGRKEQNGQKEQNR